MELISEDTQKHSDYLLLIQARLYGWSGTNTDRAKRLGLSEHTVASLMRGNAEELSLDKVIHCLEFCLSEG